MRKSETPVVAVIPAYNEERFLGGLLDQVLEQEYDDVYVLDDASTDNTVEAALAYGKDIKVICGKENVGSGANRNRIIPVLGEPALIHFLDADLRLNSDRNPERARELTSSKDMGFVGGLIRSPEGSQHPWNYGPAFSLPGYVSSRVYSRIFKIARKEPTTSRRLRELLNKWPPMEQWPDPQQEPIARDVYWSCEGNLTISSDIFGQVGGYDSSLRYHEVTDFARRLDRLGLKRRFDPSIDVTHQNREWETKPHTKEFWIALAKITGKMSVREFLLGA